VAKGAEAVGLTFEEGTPSVRVETVAADVDADDEDEPVEPEEVHTAYVRPSGQAVAQMRVPTPSNGAQPVEVELLVDAAGKLTIIAREHGAGDAVEAHA
jgi:hypothetical protein